MRVFWTFRKAQECNANDIGLNNPSNVFSLEQNCGSNSSDRDEQFTWGHLISYSPKWVKRDRRTNSQSGNAEKIVWPSGQTSSTCKCNSNTFINSMFVSSFICFWFLMFISITALRYVTFHWPAWFVCWLFYIHFYFPVFISCDFLSLAKPTQLHVPNEWWCPYI